MSNTTTAAEFTTTTAEFPDGARSRTFWIVEGLRKEFEAKVASIAKFAAKVGAMEPIVAFTGESKVRKFRRDPLTYARAAQAANPAPNSMFVFKFIEVRVTYAFPKLPGGWELLGVVDQRHNAPIVNIRADVHLPIERDTWVREAGAICTHCGTKRRRAETLLLRNEEGTYQLVGKSCAKDFLGSETFNAAALTNFSHAIGHLSSFSDYEHDEEDGDQQSFRSNFLHLNFRELIRLALIVGGKTVPVDSEAFRGDVTHFLWNDAPEVRQELQRRAEAWDKEDLEAFTDATFGFALAGTELANGYRRNLGALALTNAVSFRALNLAISAAPAYLRARGAEEQARAEASANASYSGPERYLGKVKSREIFDAVHVGPVRTFEGDYGTSWIYNFNVRGGGRLTWFSSRKLDIPAGKPLRVTATVKRHSEFRGTLQTSITRAKVEEVA